MRQFKYIALAAMLLSVTAGKAQYYNVELLDSMIWGYYGGSFKKMLYLEHTDQTYCPACDDLFYIRGTMEKNGKEYYNLKFERSFNDCGGFLMPIEVDGHYEYEEDSLGLKQGYPTYRQPLSIGIRWEDGRFYVDKEEYMSLLSDTCYCSKIGNAAYIPYEETDDGELVLYDFTKRKGDVYCKGIDGEDITVTEVTFYQTYRPMRLRLELSNGYSLIQGIGCTNSPGSLLFYMNPRQGTPIDFVRLCGFGLERKSYNDEGVTFYSASYDSAVREYLAGYKADIEEVQSASGDIMDDGLYLPNGMKVTEKPRKGIYIQGGSKRVAK